MHELDKIEMLRKENAELQARLTESRRAREGLAADRNGLAEQLGDLECARDILDNQVILLNEQKNNAYWERNQLVVALSKLFPSALERHPESDESWEDDWRWIVFIDLPTGQASWHIHDSELGNFDHLPRRKHMLLVSSWDGHTTEEKYKRLQTLPLMNDDTLTQANCLKGMAEIAASYRDEVLELRKRCAELEGKVAERETQLELVRYNVGKVDLKYAAQVIRSYAYLKPTTACLELFAVLEEL